MTDGARRSGHVCLSAVQTSFHTCFNHTMTAGNNYYEFSRHTTAYSFFFLTAVPSSLDGRGFIAGVAKTYNVRRPLSRWKTRSPPCFDPTADIPTSRVLESERRERSDGRFVGSAQVPRLQKNDPRVDTRSSRRTKRRDEGVRSVGTRRYDIIHRGALRLRALA